MRFYFRNSLLLFFGIFSGIFSNGQSAGDFDIPDVPGILSAQEKEMFNTQKEILTTRLNALQELTKQFNTTCTGKKIAEDNIELINQCKSMMAQIDNDEATLKRQIREYKKEISIAEADAKYVQHIKKSMTDLAKKLGWSDEEITRLDTALNKLGVDGDSIVNSLQIASDWSTIRQRGENTELKEKANGGVGPGLPGAGKQSTGDCAVFALANAAGLPYSVVAARAIKLITEGEWRNEEYRKDPQKVFMDGGLIGGEVLMLTEAFGQVEIIKSKDFEQTLKGGRTIMINVAPYNGNLGAGHEVVLTKTFNHNGETWFEMIDSNREGPWQRLYLNTKELQSILQENGVVYRPEKGTVPELLRKN